MSDIILWAAEHVDIWRPAAIMFLAAIVLVCLTFAIDALEPDHRRNG